MSTQPHAAPQWKEEVNRRLAAHKNRKGQGPPPETEHPEVGEGDSRAAQAAARVAARYAKAPTYSQMQAEEARVAVRAAEIATRVALRAQAAAETVLAELHAASTEEPSLRGPAIVQPILAPAPRPETPGDPAPAAREEAQAKAVDRKDSAAEPVNTQQEVPVDRQVFDIRWDPDMPVRQGGRVPAPRRTTEEFELSVEDWWSPAEVSEDLRSSPIEIGEVAPAQANLIQFPRELVATRKIRPRMAESTVVADTDSDGQLSIFEVDPGVVFSTDIAVPYPGQGEAGSTWSGMRLDAQPIEDTGSRPEAGAGASAALPVAPIAVRLMGAAVDCSLILAGFVGVGFLVAHNFPHPPAGKVAELLSVVAVAVIGWLYYALFFSIPAGTPGMKYAGIGLCTFSGSSPTREQLRRRLTAMLLSVLPLGLGLAWCLFDEDHLSWHDRFSHTYLRKL